MPQQTVEPSLSNVETVTVPSEPVAEPIDINVAYEEPKSNEDEDWRYNPDRITAQ